MMKAFENSDWWILVEVLEKIGSANEDKLRIISLFFNENDYKSEIGGKPKRSI